MRFWSGDRTASSQFDWLFKAAVVYNGSRRFDYRVSVEGDLHRTGVFASVGYYFDQRSQDQSAACFDESTPQRPKRHSKRSNGASTNAFRTRTSGMQSRKVATRYARASSDPEADSAVNELEQLTNGLATKIWNKTAAIHGIHPMD